MVSRRLVRGIADILDGIAELTAVRPFPRSTHTSSTLRAKARELDARDPLAPLRERFYCDPDVLYFDGNSLGLLSRDAEAALLRALDQWRRLAARAWLQASPPWVDYGERLGDRVAALVGAEPGEVVVTGSTTVNLHHLVAALYRPDETRHVIVAAATEFPSDLHALTGQIVLRGRDPGRSLRLIHPREGGLIEEADIESATGRDTSLLVLSAIHFRTSQRFEMARLTRHAQAAGARVIWDLSHAVGVAPVELNRIGADAAFWCHYKYLHAGPGAVGGLYLNRRHHGIRPALPGWWGQTTEAKFEMSGRHAPAPGAAAWQIGTIPILAAAPLWGALDVVEAAGIGRIREKSMALTSFLIECVDRVLPEQMRVGSPRDPERRGGHVALECLGDAPAILTRLESRGVVADYRPPNVLRLTPAPLTTRFEDVVRMVEVIGKEYTK
jgi:kynureninase